MLPINQIRPGMTFIYNDAIHLMMENKTFKIGRGRPVIKCKIKNISTGAIIIANFNERSRYEQALITKRPLQFLYTDKTSAFFCDTETFESFTLLREIINNELNFLTNDCIVDAKFYKGQPILLSLPAKVKLTIVQTDNEINTSNNITRSLKKAQLNSGYEILVPSFIKINDQIFVSTSDGKYCSRVKK